MSLVEFTLLSIKLSSVDHLADEPGLARSVSSSTHQDWTFVWKTQVFLQARCPSCHPTNC